MIKEKIIVLIATTWMRGIWIDGKLQLQRFAKIYILMVNYHIQLQLIFSKAGTHSPEFKQRLRVHAWSTTQYSTVQKCDKLVSCLLANISHIQAHNRNHNSYIAIVKMDFDWYVIGLFMRTNVFLFPAYDYVCMD